jgi:BCD family chlorophyll transporter-like MFS transporter
MLDLTVAETAGTFIGAWGLAQAIARGSATVLGGGLLDLGKTMMQSVNGETAASLPAYALVFVIQAVGMMIAVVLLSRVDIQEFQMNAKAAIATALEGDME